MPEKKVRWGVLSTARIADAVVDGIRKSGNSELVAIGSREAGKAQAWAEERGVHQAFGSYEALLASDAVDAVYIPLPNGMHKEWSVKAAEAGKHVLCEKPLASNAAEVDEIIAARDANGVKIMEAFMYRFHPQTEQVRQLVKSGAIGDLKIMRATFDFFLRRPDDVRWSQELAGGSAMDVGCYCVNISTYIMGGPPLSVSASAVWYKGGVDSSLAGTLHFEGDVLGVVDCSFQVGMGNQQGLWLSGTEGAIRVAQPFSLGEAATTITVDRSDGSTPPKEVPVPAGSKYALMVEHFADSVLNNTEPSYSLETSRSNMQVINALLDSARTGQRVDLAVTGEG